MLPAILRRRASLEPVNAFQREFERLFRNLNLWEGEDEEGRRTGLYPVDLWEDEESVHVEAEMPGFERDDVNVTVENNQLRITAERETEDRKGTEHVRERRYTRFERAFSLPADVDIGKGEATMDNGVIRLHLPKAEPSKAHRIEVKES